MQKFTCLIYSCFISFATLISIGCMTPTEVHYEEKVPEIVYSEISARYIGNAKKFFMYSVNSEETPFALYYATTANTIATQSGQPPANTKLKTDSDNIKAFIFLRKEEVSDIARKLEKMLLTEKPDLNSEMQLIKVNVQNTTNQLTFSRNTSGKKLVYTLDVNGYIYYSSYGFLHGYIVEPMKENTLWELVNLLKSVSDEADSLPDESSLSSAINTNENISVE